MAFLDECGFSPSQPVSASWTLPGERKLIAYENPRGRRVNAVSGLIPWGPHHSLWWGVLGRTLTAEDIVTVIPQLPRGRRGLVVVLDNGPIHVSHVVQAMLPEWRRQGIHLYYLPPYSPELNRIEPTFGVLKQYELPERTYPTVDDLKAAVHAAFLRCEARLLRQTQLHLRPTA